MSYIGNKPADKLLYSNDIAPGAVSTINVADDAINASKISSIDISLLASKIQALSTAISANALTITLEPTSLNFRNSASSNGSVTSSANLSPISITIPTGATLGTTNNNSARLVVIALQTGDMIDQLGVVNISGGVNLDETGLITTIAIDASSDLATTVYSTIARTSVPYRVVGYVESTQATAGAWITSPSLVQGYGGQALASMSSLGYGQTWQLVTRVSGTTYYNTTGKPIFGNVYGRKTGAGDCTIQLTIAGTTHNIAASYSPADAATGSGSYIVGPGESYILTNTGYTTAFIVTERR